MPGSLDAGDGFWRRCIPIPFTVQIPEADLVRDLDKCIIATEPSGVLNWALQGAIEWARDGRAVPKVITQSVQSYREETDVLGLWMDERTKPDSKAKVLVGDAFTDYEDFCKSQGMSAGSAMTFSRAMTDREESVTVECVYLHACKTGSQAKASVGRWITFYYHQRSHAIRREIDPPDQFLILVKHGGQPPAVGYFNATQTDQQVQAVA